MNARRSKISILVDILRLILRKNNKAKPTHILYGANLSHLRLKKYLGLLLENQFIEEFAESEHKFYRVTTKGLEFMQEFRKVQQFSEAFGISV